MFLGPGYPQGREAPQAIHILWITLWNSADISGQKGRDRRVRVALAHPSTLIAQRGCSMTRCCRGHARDACSTYT